jgi:glycolate oxidase FAD binding subunit
MDAILKPADADDVAEAVAQALAGQRTLEIVGRASRRGYGRPARADTVLDLSALSGIVDYDPAELVLTALPATPLRDIAALLAEHGQCLLFEPPSFSALWGGAEGDGSLGGALSQGLGGPRRPSAGAPRDHFLGFKAVNGFGQAFAAGGRVVKNVTGYDLPKLLAGAMGSLGVLTEVTVRALPRPAARATLALSGLSDARALWAMTAALNSPSQVSGAAHLPQGLDGASAPLTLLRLEGVEISIAARLAHLTTLLGTLGPVDRWDDPATQAVWRDLADLRALAPTPDALVWRVSLPPAASVAFTAQLPRQLGARWIYDWGGGLVWLFLQPADHAHAMVVRQVLRDTAGRDGHATLLRAPAAVRGRVSPFQPLEPGLAALTQRVRRQFDPEGLFNPGRLYEGP